MNLRSVLMYVHQQVIKIYVGRIIVDQVLNVNSVANDFTLNYRCLHT